MQADIILSGPKEPAAHREQLAVPLTAEKEPTGHWEHTLAPSPWGDVVFKGYGPQEKLPGLQSEQTAALPVENLPGTHRWHLVRPGWPCDRPGAQGVQFLAPSRLKEPAEQLRQAEAPGPEKVPATQLKHTLDRLYGLKVPGEHGVHSS